MTRKRGQNEGSIVKRKNGTYMVQLTVSEKRITKYFKTKTEANEYRIDTLNKIHKGLFYSGPDLTLSEYFEEWLKSHKNAVKPKTHLQYQQIIRQHINPTLGKTKISELEPFQIQALYDKKVENGIGVRTVRLIHSVLHCSLNHALRLGLIYRNPSDAVYKPKVKKREMAILDENQVRSFLLSARGKKYEALYKLAITTGLRKGEILGLKWADLDWSTGQLNIQRQVQRVPQKGLVFTESKTSAGRRMVLLGSDMLESLKAHYKRQLAEKDFMGDRWQEEGLIFPSSFGTPLSQSNLSSRYKEILKEANLPGIRFHDLRHTAASLMLKQGVSVKVVQERLGHSDAAMTLNVYSHTIPGMQREAAEKMDEITAIIDASEMFEEVENESGLQ